MAPIHEALADLACLNLKEKFAQDEIVAKWGPKRRAVRRIWRSCTTHIVLNDFYKQPLTTYGTFTYTGIWRPNYEVIFKRFIKTPEPAGSTRPGPVDNRWREIDRRICAALKDDTPDLVEKYRSIAYRLHIRRLLLKHERESLKGALIRVLTCLYWYHRATREIRDELAKFEKKKHEEKLRLARDKGARREVQRLRQIQADQKRAQRQRLRKVREPEKAEIEKEEHAERLRLARDRTARREAQRLRQIQAVQKRAQRQRLRKVREGAGEG